MIICMYLYVCVSACDHSSALGLGSGHSLRVPDSALWEDICVPHTELETESQGGRNMTILGVRFLKV